MKENMNATATAERPQAVLSKLTDFPTYVTALAELKLIRQDVAVTESDILECESQIAAPSYQPRDADGEIDAALHLASGGSLPPGRDSIRERHVELKRKLATLNRGALSASERVDAAIASASLAVCLAASEDFLAVAKMKLAALQQLTDADDQELAIRSRIEANGMSSTYWPSMINFAIGRVDDGYSVAATTAKELRILLLSRS